MKETERFHLNQWDPTDRILREDFNRDNKNIDAALTTLEAAVPGRLGKMEVIRTYKSSGSPMQAGGFAVPRITWDDWEYVCVLVSYPNVEAGNQNKVSLSLGFEDMTSLTFDLLALPAQMAILLPRHDGSANMAGFVLADRLIPFQYDHPFRQFDSIGCDVRPNTVTSPAISFFGGK